MPNAPAFAGEAIGFSFQSNNLVPYLNARENVELMLRLNGKLDRAAKQRSEELLVRLGLGERMKNYPGQLSGGQQQRVAIARASDPRAADCPGRRADCQPGYGARQPGGRNLCPVDPRARSRRIMVTHDLRMCKYVDRVIRMRDGKISQVVSDRKEIDELANMYALAS